MIMAQAQTAGSRFDGLKWLLVLVILAGGVVANYYFISVALSIRAAIGIVLACVALGVAVQTAKGQVAWGFIKASRNEMRKVVWPTRPETIQTTVMVIVMVVVTSMILWGLDTLFVYLVGLLAGHGG
jgi:preprotein translocase subunit SecE